jgi:hypothetical protein
MMVPRVRDPPAANSDQGDTGGDIYPYNSSNGPLHIEIPDTFRFHWVGRRRSARRRYYRA